MYEFELQKAADKLVNDMFAVKPGEEVVITTDTRSCPAVANAIASAVFAAGAHPLVVNNPAPHGVGKAGDPELPVECLSALLEQCDVWIELNKVWLLYSTPFERAFEKNKKLRYICMVEFDEELFIRVIGDVETKQLRTFMEKFAQMNRDAKHAKVTTPAGTNVEFDIEPRHKVACDAGDCSVPGMHMVTGQINVVPRFDSINGTIVFDGTIIPPFGHKPDEPVRLTVEKGVITKIEGGADARAYDQFLHSFNDEGMFKMAHIAYGFNPGAKLTGNVVEDERVWGVTEWGIGYVSPVDAPPEGQNAASHSDGICLNSSVWLDDVQVLDEGKVTLPELNAIYQH